MENFEKRLSELHPDFSKNNHSSVTQFREKRELDEPIILYRPKAEEEVKRLIEGGFIKEARLFEKVIQFIKTVENIGGRALVVGGAVRDELMGIPPKDYDVEVYGIPPEKLRELVKSFGPVYEVGAAFGILKLKVEDREIDISLPRRESKTGRGHKDFSINADPYMSIKEAARRRDFTFNTLAKDVLKGEIYDYFNGIADIQQRILRVTDEERFRDDALRVLRGMQFIGRFGLMVEDRTAMIMREMRSELKYIAKERIKEEWVKLFLKSKKPSLGLQAAMEWGIFHEMHPEIVKLTQTPQEPEWHPEGDVWIHTLMSVDTAAQIVEEEQLTGKEALIVLLAAFCHDFGKPLVTKEIEGKIRSRGHEEAGAEPAAKFLAEIGIEPSLREPIIKLVTEHLKPTLFYLQEKKGQKITDGAIRRLAFKLSPATLKELVCVAKADHLGRGPFVDPNEPEKSFIPKDYPAGDWLLQRASRLGIFESKPKPIIFGRDLIALGFPPGPLLGQIIKASEEMHVKGFSREEILSFIYENKSSPPEELLEKIRNKNPENKKEV
jgi:tRNA nucleotidyltransferase (CCA-adding enzyme)